MTTPACCPPPSRSPWRAVSAALAILGAGAILFVSRGNRDAATSRSSPDEQATATANGEASAGPTDRGPASDVARAVETFLHAEATGNVAAYRESITGSLAAQIDSRLKQESAASVADSIRQGALDLKGQVTSDVRFDGSDAATIAVELIFADRHELRRIELRRDRDRWRVSSSRTERTFAPAVKYGTPVGG
jgi:hypothetical protein